MVLKDIPTLGRVLNFEEREMASKRKERFWIGDVPKRDDFGLAIDKVFFDGRTQQGPWAIMTPYSWRAYGVGRTGLGRGQKYEKQTDGKWLKTEG